MHRVVLSILLVVKYALYSVAGAMALCAIYVLGVVAAIFIGESTGFNLADHMTKDQNCMVAGTPPKGCPGNRTEKSN